MNESTDATLFARLDELQRRYRRLKLIVTGFLVVIVALTVFVLGRGGRYQIATDAQGQHLYRLDTATGEVRWLVNEGIMDGDPSPGDRIIEYGSVPPAR